MYLYNEQESWNDLYSWRYGEYMILYLFYSFIAIGFVYQAIIVDIVVVIYELVCTGSLVI